MNGKNSKRPLAFNAQKNTPYFWCSCGLSQHQPLCDGSHQGSAFQPVQFQVDEDKTVYLCGCKKTGHRPFCDGSHQFLDGSGRDQYYDEN